MGDVERLDRWWPIVANDIDRKPKANLPVPLFVLIGPSCHCDKTMAHKALFT